MPQYELTGTPPGGMTIDSASGLIEWMPTTGQEGPHNITVRAWNSEGEDTRTTISMFPVQPVPRT